MTAPGWFADPSREHALRYWDGSVWTMHVADPVPAFPPPPASVHRRPVRTRRAAGWVGLLLCVAAAVATWAQVTSFADDTDGPRSGVDSSPRRVSLAPDTTYGIFVDDVDGDGYSLDCSVEDPAGRPIPLRSPSWYVTESDTESLDYRFDSGAGDVVISCDSSGDPVETRPSAPVGAVTATAAGSALAGTIGLTLLALWLVSWLQSRSARSHAAHQP
jgi:hypothetical protein